MIAEVLRAHLRAFITCEPNYRLIHSCHKFWSETGNLPTIMDIVGMCKKYKATTGQDDKLMVANILGESVHHIEDIYNLFLTRFICCFGIFPSKEDTENSFSFFLHAKRFPSPAEMTEVAFHLQEASDLHASSSSSSSKKKKNNIDKLAALTSIISTGLAGLAKDTDCCICLETFKVGDLVTRLECTHTFHYGSLSSSSSPSAPSAGCGGISTWLLTNDSCPVCKKIFKF